MGKRSKVAIRDRTRGAFGTCRYPKSNYPTQSDLRRLKDFQSNEQCVDKLFTTHTFGWILNHPRHDGVKQFMREYYNV